MPAHGGIEASCEPELCLRHPAAPSAAGTAVPVRERTRGQSMPIAQCFSGCGLAFDLHYPGQSRRSVTMFKSFAAVCLAAIATVPLAARSNALPEKFTAFAINVSNMTPRAQTTPVDITINRFSSDADRDRLVAILRDKGQDALLAALQKMPVVGYMTTPGSL